VGLVGGYLSAFWLCVVVCLGGLLEYIQCGRFDHCGLLGVFSSRMFMGGRHVLTCLLGRVVFPMVVREELVGMVGYGFAYSLLGVVGCFRLEGGVGCVM